MVAVLAVVSDPAYNHTSVLLTAVGSEQAGKRVDLSNYLFFNLVQQEQNTCHHSFMNLVMRQIRQE